jgi:hypothetical protein
MTDRRQREREPEVLAAKKDYLKLRDEVKGGQYTSYKFLTIKYLTSRNYTLTDKKPPIIQPCCQNIVNTNSYCLKDQVTKQPYNRSAKTEIKFGLARPLMKALPPMFGLGQRTTTYVNETK